MDLQNVGILPQHYTASQPSRGLDLKLILLFTTVKGYVTETLKLNRSIVVMFENRVLRKILIGLRKRK
jgi:hypothetical protein